MHTICGIDGCRTGWVVAWLDLDTRKSSVQVIRSITELKQFSPAPDVITIDIPIGLPDSDSRECDRLARQILGPGRASSVFTAPIRPVLEARSYSEAADIRYHIEQKRMSWQAWGIVSKVREVDHFLRNKPEFASWMWEAHPEVCFYSMSNGTPRLQSKKTPAGRLARLQLLSPYFGHAVASALTARHPSECAQDDILDAFAVLWTAERVLTGSARTIPPCPSADRFGLPMRITN